MINKRTVNGSVILDIAEASDLEVLQTCILETLHQGQHRLALNLCCLDFTESTDLAILMLAYKVCCEDGGDLVL
jgi:anti-anti-sigma regulatory factor